MLNTKQDRTEQDKTRQSLDQNSDDNFRVMIEKVPVRTESPGDK